VSTKMEANVNAVLKAQKIGNNLLVAAIVRPHIEYRKCRFIHKRDSKTVHRHVDCFQVVATGIASLDVNGGPVVGGEAGQLFFVFFAAPGTDQPPKSPFAQAETTEQPASRSISFGAKYGHLWKAAACGASIPTRVTAFWLLKLQVLRERLETGSAEEIVGASRRREIGVHCRFQTLTPLSFSWRHPVFGCFAEQVSSVFCGQ